MTIIRAKNTGRINVWPSHLIAQMTDTERSRIFRRMNVWPHTEDARENTEYNDSLGNGGSYTGPLDIISGAVVAYSQRAMSAALLGSPLYTIKRSSDSTTQEFNSDPVTGAAPISEIEAFIGAGTGSGLFWKNQVSSYVGDSESLVSIWQNTPDFSSTGIVAFSSPGGAPPFSRDAGLPSTGFVIVEIDASDTEGFYCPFFADTTGGSSAYFGTFLGNFSGTPFVDFEISDAAGTYTEYDSANLPPTGLVIVEFVVTVAGVPSLFINGTNQSISLISGTQQALPALPAGNINFQLPRDSEDAIHSNLREALIYDVELSAPDRLAIRQNIATYYGITLP